MARFQRRKWSIWNGPSINTTSRLGLITECLFMPSHWSHLCVIRLLPMLSIPDQLSCIAGTYFSRGQCLLCSSLKSSPFSFIVPKRTWALQVMGPCAKSPCATKWDHQTFSPLFPTKESQGFLKLAHLSTFQDDNLRALFLLTKCVCHFKSRGFIISSLQIAFPKFRNLATKRFQRCFSHFQRFWP